MRAAISVEMGSNSIATAALTDAQLLDQYYACKYIIIIITLQVYIFVLGFYFFLKNLTLVLIFQLKLCCNNKCFMTGVCTASQTVGRRRKRSLINPPADLTSAESRRSKRQATPVATTQMRTFGAVLRFLLRSIEPTCNLVYVP